MAQSVEMQKIQEEREKWSPKGYQKLANLMGSHQEIAIFRGFGALTMLNLLSLQAELIDIEVQLRETCRDDDVGRNDATTNLNDATTNLNDATTKMFSVDFYALRHAEMAGPRFRLVATSQQKLQAYRG